MGLFCTGMEMGGEGKERKEVEVEMGEEVFMLEIVQYGDGQEGRKMTRVWVWVFCSFFPPFFL